MAFSRSAMARMGVMPMPPAISTWWLPPSSMRNRFLGPASCTVSPALSTSQKWREPPRPPASRCTTTW